MRKTILALFSFGLAFAACGDPTPTNRFEFTPVAYTVLPTSATPPGEMLIVDDGPRGLYLADEVVVTLHAPDVDGFNRWASIVGFDVRNEFDLRNGDMLVFVGVPPGSADDAIAFIRSRRAEAVSVDRSVLATGNGS